jgi:hypothetical protein
MIQMRENRYNDIRAAIVNRSSETNDYRPSSNPDNPGNGFNFAGSEKEKKKIPDPAAQTEQGNEYSEDEYNSWS